ncbi:MAG: ComEA family DNA-binding protein [Pyrinomonadaceae bacterium]
MKQNLPPAKIRTLLIALAVLSAILLASACATPPRSSPSAAQISLDLSRTEHTSAININTASLRELENLPGVGSGIAERIVAHREQYGPFRRPEHLMMVRGISDRKFRALRATIVVE